jgi:hypothetical protein
LPGDGDDARVETFGELYPVLVWGAQRTIWAGTRLSRRGQRRAPDRRPGQRRADGHEPGPQEVAPLKLAHRSSLSASAGGEDDLGSFREILGAQLVQP